MERLIWVHAQTEQDISALKDAARRGVYVELDTVGAPYQSQQQVVETALALIESGFIAQILLSHDAGWYNPADSNGLPENGYRRYTALTNDFIPKLLSRGVSEEQIRQITMRNPVRAFAF